MSGERKPLASWGEAIDWLISSACFRSKPGRLGFGRIRVTRLSGTSTYSRDRGLEQTISSATSFTGQHDGKPGRRWTSLRPCSSCWRFGEGVCRRLQSVVSIAGRRARRITRSNPSMRSIGFVEFAPAERSLPMCTLSGILSRNRLYQAPAVADSRQPGATRELGVLHLTEYEMP